MDGDATPLCASTPKKMKLNESETTGETGSYIFISDSEAEDSELLYFTSDLGEEEEGTVEDLATEESESILFLSDDNTLTSDQPDVEGAGEECKPCCSKESILEQECCTDGCLQNFTFKEFNVATEHFQSKSKDEQRQYLHDSILFSSPSASKSTKERFMLFGKSACRKAFAVLLSTNESRLEHIKQNCGTAVKLVHGNQGIKRPTSKSLEASAWMKSYFERLGDYVPDSNRIHLPSFLTKREIYQKMHTDLLESGIKDIVSQSTFYELWERDFNHVLTPEVSYYIQTLLFNVMHCVYTRVRKNG